MRSLFHKRLIRLIILYAAAIALGELLFVGYMYVAGSATVDYAAAQVEARHQVDVGVWSQPQADAWLRMHAQRFWDEVWDRSRVYLLLALIVLFGIVTFTWILPILRG